MSYQSLSAEKVEQNEDLLSLILFRVPAKSLVRSKCVSKRWHHLICDSTFANNHTRNKLHLLVSGLYSDSRPMLSFKTNSPNGHQSLPKLNFLSTTNQSEVTILHSYNGLMLCSRGPDYIVCNLTTQKHKVIPSFYDHVPGLPEEKFIAFEPTKSSHYTVVFLNISVDSDGLFVMDGSYCMYRADIYSSKSRTWKRILFGHQGTYPFTEKVFCDGSIYWIDEDNKIIQLNIDEEKWKIVQLRSQPLITIDEYPTVWFGEFGGRLFLVQAVSSIDYCTRVFEMDVQTFHLNVKFTFDLGPILNTLPANVSMRDHSSVQVLCLKEGDDHENPMLVFVLKGKIISYNPNGGRLEFLEGVLGNAFGCAHKFIESLATI